MHNNLVFNSNNDRLILIANGQFGLAERIKGLKIFTLIFLIFV